MEAKRLRDAEAGAYDESTDTVEIKGWLDGEEVVLALHGENAAALSDALGRMFEDRRSRDAEAERDDPAAIRRTKESGGAT